jgi:sigma-E factor negative regulatory protein RseA
MAEKINEQLSALVDGEHERAELELLLRRMSGDSSLLNRWERFHMVSDTIRQHLPETITVGFAQQVMAAIDNESSIPVTPAQAVSRLAAPWLKPVIGFALAASVATVAVLSFDPDGPSPGNSQPLALSDPGAGFAMLVDYPFADEPGVDQRLSAYLVNHSEYVSMNGVNGVIPYVRMVGYQASR